MADGADITQAACMRVMVRAVHGSAPREAGAEMQVWQGGQSGTIGGGVLEWNAAKHARKMLESGAVEDHQSVALGPEIGQCCGGRVELLFRRGPREAAAVLQPVFLYGAGHVGREIMRVLAGLPFAMSWVDVAEARFPPGAKNPLIHANPAAAVALAPDEAFHFVLTHSHAHDLEICHQVLSRPFGHLGLIGSATKKTIFLKRLRELGHRDERLKRLQCPIGDPALGKTPAGIAIGVAHWLMRAQNEMKEPRGEGRA